MKKFKNCLVALALCLVLVLAVGCHEGMVTTTMELKAGGKGTKTITVEVLANKSLVPGKDYSPDNQHEYLLIWGTNLQTWVVEHCALKDGVTVEVTPTSTDPMAAEATESTFIKLTYTFDSIADYNTKTKTIAAEKAENIEDATFTANTDGTYTFKENIENTGNTVYSLMNALFSDTNAFSLEAYAITLDQMYKIVSVSATVGSETKTETLWNYADAMEGEFNDYLEVTGTPAADPISSTGSDSSSAKGCGSSVIAVSSVVALLVAGAAVVLTKKKED